MLNTWCNSKPESLMEIAEEMRVRKTSEVFVLFSLGSQFDHLIKQRLEKLEVFCLVADPASITAADVAELKPKGIILSGGPTSVYEEPPPFDGRIFDLGIPVLGICLGFQLWSKHIGAEVVPAPKREFGVHQFYYGHSPFRRLINRWFNRDEAFLFASCPNGMDVLQSHGDKVTTCKGMEIIGRTDNAPVAAARFGHLWGVQFHPEVTETKYGEKILENFCFKICKAHDRFPAEQVAGKKIAELKKKIGEDKVLLALSGGSDSSTLGYLLKEAVDGKPGRIHAVYIKGIDRPDDEAFVRKYFGNEPWLTLEVIDATADFLEALKGKITMKEKRVAMRGVYKRILEEAAAKFGAKFIAQGTLYTDISESGGGYVSGAKKARIKLHHNTNLGFSLAELTPLDDCVKDNGRNIGRSIGVPEELLTRHPFPGPGLVVRIEGEITAEKLAIARQADGIYIEELRRWNLYDSVWQAGAVVTQSITTCTKGDGDASGLVLALWAVWSVNGFTARSADLPTDFQKQVSRRLTNEIREVGSVVYRISDKPPATIEWG